ncbi:aspartate 1-decarboxylase [Hathewaya histolytica]|uniref:Aspartate 1-decarboxylase n=1 Tax=Hathewaya histolytica TaxID=1498 RepID=A0A4U9RPC7_HATHI|nr:aspartate 1-decarboxylase [Hathewaya histolytica]VTQ93448.1 aspartate alpha-decarboxylase [Hathewaya histolytica]
MHITMLKSKIHRATITEANLNYVGSITIDTALLKSSGILEYEKVQIVDIDNGERLETYVIPGEENSGMICLNGAAARLVQKGDKIIIMSYALMDEKEAKKYNPTVVFVDEKNRVSEVTNYESHGEIK